MHFTRNIAKRLKINNDLRDGIHDRYLRGECTIDEYGDALMDMEECDPLYDEIATRRGLKI